jgi:hypothetical protein
MVTSFHTSGCSKINMANILGTTFFIKYFVQKIIFFRLKKCKFSHPKKTLVKISPKLVLCMYMVFDISVKCILKYIYM